MSSTQSRSPRAIERFARWVIKHRLLVLAVTVVIAMGIGYGGKLLQFTPSYSAYFSGENPELNAFESFKKTYTKNDNFFFVIQPRDGNVFSRETLSAVEEATKAAWQIPFANRVDSLSNFQNTYARGEDLVVEDLYSNAPGMSADDISRVRRVAENEPLLNGLLLSEAATGVNVVLQFPGQSLYEVPTAAAKAREIKQSIEEAYPSVSVYLTGFGMLNNAFGESAYMDSQKLVPMMYGVLVVVALLVLRSVVGTLATLAVAFLSVGVGMGVGGFTGVLLTPVSTSVPVIIITLAVADSVHLFTSIRRLMREGIKKDDAIARAMTSNFTAVTVTSLTTVVGFLALNFSDSPPYWHVGNLASAGIIAGWLLSLTLFPALVSLLPYKPKVSETGDWADRLSGRLGEMVVRNAKSVLILTVAGAVGLIAMVPSVSLDDKWSEYFDESIEFRRDTDAANLQFGLYPIEYSVSSGAAQGVVAPEYLSKLDEFAAFLRAQPQVAHVYSITDVLKRLNKNLNGDNDAFYSLPESRESAADALLLYELSLPYGLDLNDRLNVDKSASRVTVMLRQTTTKETKAFLSNVDAWIASNFTGEMRETRPTSAHVMFTFITDRNVSSMIAGTLTAIALIALVLAMTLRSVKLGLLSLLPNGLPILCAFGAWALTYQTIGFSVAAVAAISLGIVVDDTVHFLTKYVAARRDGGASAQDAVRISLRTVGPAMISSTLILVCGFLVMASSTFKINQDLGALTAITIALALVFDLLLLPALMVMLSSSKEGLARGKPEGAGRLASASTGLSVALLGGLVMALSSPQRLHAAETGGAGDSSKGYEVSARSDRTDMGFGQSRVSAKMILKNAAGDTAQRDISLLTLEKDSEQVGDKSIVIFDSPADVRGTALLSHAKMTEPDDQWIYMSSSHRTKRISSRNKSGPFVGSEFAFEDFTAMELNKFSHEWLRTEQCGDLSCDVVKRVPRYEYSGYSYLLVWIDTAEYQVRKIEFYDRKGELLKTGELDDYKKFGGYWRSLHWTMTNHQTNKVTEFKFDDYDFGADLTAGDFVKGRLSSLN